MRKRNFVAYLNAGGGGQIDGEARVLGGDRETLDKGTLGHLLVSMWTSVTTEIVELGLWQLQNVVRRHTEISNRTSQGRLQHRMSFATSTQGVDF